MSDERLGLITSTAVHKAIEECDRLGEVVFLKKYGFRRSRKFPFYYKGVPYASKAILLVAYGFQYPAEGPIGAYDGISGGQHILDRLHELGFDSDDGGQTQKSRSIKHRKSTK